MSFFTLRTPQDMLAKARREHQRLCQNFDIDGVFNFFVTAHHIADYVRRASTVPQVALDTFMQDQDIKRCRDLCDKGKHVTLTKREGPVAQVRTSGGALGLDGLGLAPLGCPTVTWLLQFGDESVELLPLAERVLGKWKGFFQANGL